MVCWNPKLKTLVATASCSTCKYALPHGVNAAPVCRDYNGFAGETVYQSIFRC